MREIVISFRRGKSLDTLASMGVPGDTLEKVVNGIATVNVTEVLPPGRVLIARVSDSAFDKLEARIGSACHLVDRKAGHVLRPAASHARQSIR